MIDASSPFERALILAPLGRDGPIASAILLEAGLRAVVCADLPELARVARQGCGVAIVADEALHDADLRPLVSFLHEQPSWSDLPLVVLTRRGGGPERNPATARIAELLGNVTFVERPFHAATLVSLVRSALRARERQYETRSRMEELAEAERRLQTALLGGQLGSWTFDVRSQRIESSATCRAHFGRRADEPFTYDDLRAAVVEEDRARREAGVERCIRRGEDFQAEYRVVWPDGSRHWLDSRARAVRDATGEVCQLVGVISDITARKTADAERDALLGALAGERAALAELTRTLEQRVRESTAELMSAVAAREKAQEQLLQSQKMETIGQLTGGVAHDFNNLLTAIMANLELLRKRVPEDARLHALIDSAMLGASRGATLTQRMLAFARQQHLKTTAVGLRDLLDGMRDLLERSLGPATTLSIDVAPDLPAAQVDTNQVELAVLNLVINARDAMPRGGSIRILAGRGPDTGSGALLFLRVADNGDGMDEVTLRRCIEPFFSTKAPGRGTGLGLSMVHGLAVQLGGSLELASQRGVGTTATLWLPAADREPAGKERAVSESLPRVQACILLVDDDALIRMSTVAMLEELGHEVIAADSARAALEILAAHGNIDLLLTDHAMPEMTGLELIALVRDRRPHLPVLLATGYAELPPGEHADVARLAKPFRLAQLQAAIVRLLTTPAHGGSGKVRELRNA